MYTEDGYFVQRCLNGDSAAFGFLVDKYKACVFSLAYTKRGNFHDAQDITQEVFIRVYQKLHTFKPSEKFKPWLYVITSNLCIDFLRKQSKRPDCISIDATMLNSVTVAAYQRQSQHDAIHAALSELPEIYRTTLTLYYLGGMKNREIAEFLGTSKNTVESRLRRARAKLKQEMIAIMQQTFDNAQLQP